LLKGFKGQRVQLQRSRSYDQAKYGGGIHFNVVAEGVGPIFARIVGCYFRRKTPVLRPPLWGLGTTYNDHLRLIGKRVVDFLLMLIELFFARCYGFTAEALRANIGSKSAISLQRRPVDPKFQVEGIARHQAFSFLGN